VLHQPNLTAIRALLIEKINEAGLAGQRLASPDVSMPRSLLAASMWLAAQGYDGEACEGERFFGWSPSAYRQYLDRLSPNAVAEEVEGGRKVLFVGNSRRAPLVELVAELAQAA
jgi:hypothetical protein